MRDGDDGGMLHLLAQDLLHPARRGEVDGRRCLFRHNSKKNESANLGKAEKEGEFFWVGGERVIQGCCLNLGSWMYPGLRCYLGPAGA